MKQIPDKRWKVFGKAADCILSVIFLPFIRLRKSKEPRNIKKVLVIRVDNIGDVILLTPFLECLKKAYPACYVTVLLRAASSVVLKNNPYSDNIIIHDPPWSTGNRDTSQNKIYKYLLRIKKYSLYLPNYLKLVAQLRKEKFDLAFDARGDFRNIFLYGFLSGSKEIIGYNRTGGAKFLTTCLPFDYNKHEIDNNLDLLKALSVDTKNFRQVQLYPNSDDVFYANNLLAKLNISSDDFSVCISPGAKIIQQWPKERFAELIDILIERYRAKVLISGTRGEAKLAQEIRELSRQTVHVLNGKLSLLQFAALLKKMSLLICLDSGALHIAGAMKTPTICLFGPTNVERFCYSNVFSIQKMQPCLPILHEKCYRNPKNVHGDCINLIDVDDVIEKVNVLYKR